MGARRTGTAIQRAPKQEQIDTALLAVWLEAGNITRASETTGIAASTIQGWLKRYPERYQELRELNAPRYDRTIATKQEAIVLKGLETVMKLVEQVDQDLQDGELAQPDRAAQRLATVLGIVTDKWLLIQGRPNHIVDRGDASEKLNALKARFPWLVTDSTAEEIADDA